MGKIIDGINWGTRTFDSKKYSGPIVRPEAPAVPPKPERPRKEAISISVMPEQAFPVGHQDFRPLLQRDGLILMSWSRWEDWNHDGSLLRRYIVTWATSGRNCRHYASDSVLEDNMAEAVPGRRADSFFYRGLYGNRWISEDYQDDDIADYVYLTAPFDLDHNTVPGFIKVLKALGYTNDFDFVFTLTGERIRQSKAREYLNNLSLTEAAKS